MTAKILAKTASQKGTGSPNPLVLESERGAIGSFCASQKIFLDMELARS